MKKTVGYVLSCVIVTMFISCKGLNEESIIVKTDDFTDKETLLGEEIEFDSIFGVCGCVIPVDSLYICYLYQSDNYLMVTDCEFNILGFTAHRGSGPGEVSQISSLYGHILKNTDLAVLDPNKRAVYGSDIYNWSNLTLKLDLSDTDVPTPLYLEELNNGKYLMAHLNYEYGLYAYDRKDGSVDYWPVGLNLPDNKKYDISCSRGMEYNRTNDIIVEYYPVLPVLILHDAEGNVLRKLQYADMPEMDDLDEDSPNLIESAWLTDNYIFTLLGYDNQSEDPDAMQKIAVTDYCGNPVVSFNIKPANFISVDVSNRRLIAVNPDAENSITIYRIPDRIYLK